MNQSNKSPQAVDRIVERLLPQMEQAFRGLNADERYKITRMAVEAALDNPEGSRDLMGTQTLESLPEELREALDQPTRRVHAPVDRVDHEVPRV